MRVRFLVLSCALFALMVPRVALAQAIPGWNQRSFTAEQIDADRIRLMREVEIEGEPNSPNAGQKFFADDLQMNVKTGELIAIGNVVFSTPTSRISADSVTFNTKTKMGTFTNAVGIAQLGARGQRNISMFGTLEPDVYFAGATIEKIGLDKYKITKGGFTTCVQPTPRWEIVSGTSTLNMDDYVLMKNAIVHVKDVPVFYLPLLYYPIQSDDRATGILMPMYGSSLAAGATISNAFFWAINRSMDATLFHDWMFSRGNGLGSEYRYMLGPAAQGDFRYYWLDEKEAEINGGLRPARRSTKINGGLSQNLPLGLSARARVDYFTDVTVQQTYNHDFAAAANSSRTYQAGVSGAWRNLSANGTYNRTEVFRDANSSTVSGQSPGFTTALSGVKVGKLPLFASVNAEGGQHIYINRFGSIEQDLSLVKTDFAPSIRAPLSTLPYLQVNASAAFRTTYYSESLADDKKTQVEVPITRNYADMRVDLVGPVLSRVFNPNNAMADRMKHVVEPTFSVSRRTEIDNQDRIPSATGYDVVVGGTTQMSYGLTNRVLVRKDAEGQPQSGAPREFLNFSVRQTYYTDANASKYDQSYSYGFNTRPPNAFSPISVLARATPTIPMGIDFRMEYDPLALPGGPKLLGMGLNGLYRTAAVNASGGWSRTAYALTSNTGAVTNASNMIQGSSDFRILQSSWSGMVSFQYDVTQSTLLSQRYVGAYSAQCCGVSFEYQAVNYPNSSQFFIPQDRRFNMSFTLAGVGSFANFFGAFGGSTR